jgi:hypothetical protein
MFDHAEHLVELRAEKDDLERQLKEVNGEINDTEFLLVTAMTDAETQSFNRAGRMFSLTSKVRAAAVAGRKEELFDALKAEGFGDLVYETVNVNSLSSFVKEQTAENGDVLPEWLAGLVSVYEKPGISVRKSTK